MVASVAVVLKEVHGPGHEHEYEKDEKYGGDERSEREEALQGVDVIDVLLVIGRF